MDLSEKVKSYRKPINFQITRTIEKLTIENGSVEFR